MSSPTLHEKFLCCVLLQKDSLGDNLETRKHQQASHLLSVVRSTLELEDQWLQKGHSWNLHWQWTKTTSDLYCFLTSYLGIEKLGNTQKAEELIFSPLQWMRLSFSLPMKNLMCTVWNKSRVMFQISYVMFVPISILASTHLLSVQFANS